MAVCATCAKHSTETGALSVSGDQLRPPEHKRHWEPAEPTAIVTIHCSDSIPGRGSQTMFGPALFKARRKYKDRRKKVEMNANEKDSSKPF